MDLNIIKIAADTKNNQLLNVYDLKIKQKNSICGDKIEISLEIKKNKIYKIGFECNSCIYSQASAALLSNFSINKTLSEINELRLFLENYFKNRESMFPKKWKIFKKLINKKNISRKECLMLPFNAIYKISKINKYE